MNPKPGIISILLNDNWAAPVAGVFIMSMIMTCIVMITEPFTGSVKGVNPEAFLLLTGAALITALITSIYRIGYVRQVFENGEIVKAAVVDRSVFRSNLRLKLRYVFRGETQEKKLEQVITSRTKVFLHENEVTLVIDQKNPNHILLLDAYV